MFTVELNLSILGILFLLLLGMSSAASFQGVACVDSDGGANLFVRGTGTGYYSNGGGYATIPNAVFGENANSASSGSYRVDTSLNGTAIFYDHCQDSENSNQLNEVQCDANLGMLVSYGQTCQYGCKEGACVTCAGNVCNPSNSLQYCSNGNWASCSSGQSCSAGACINAPPANTSTNSNASSNVSNNNSQSGSTTPSAPFVIPPVQVPVQSVCSQGACNSENSKLICSSGQWVECPNNAACSNRICVLLNQSVKRESSEENQDKVNNPLSSKNKSISTEPVLQCGGCIENGRCLPIGYRAAGNYCMLSGSFESQRAEAAVCENNFECSSNICSTGKCVRGDLIVELIQLLKRFFGIK